VAPRAHSLVEASLKLGTRAREHERALVAGMPDVGTWTFGRLNCAFVLFVARLDAVFPQTALAHGD